MTTSTYQTDVDLPWPLAWEMMQWEMAAWVAEYGDRALVQVIWNERILAAQVEAAEFQAITTDFYRTLQHRLGHACQWRFEKQEELTGHRLILGVSAP